MSKFFEQIKNDFDNWGKACIINDFMEDVKKSLKEKKFKKENSRLIFSVCPDDVNRLQEIKTIENALKGEYGGEFHLGGLGAYPIGGVSGITAASHHPPDNIINGDRKDGNLIFFVSPHMGLIEKENFIYGKIIRPGQIKVTSSCGAMMGFLGALKQAGTPESFNIAPDGNNTDPTRMVLHQELISNYSDRLKDILAIENDNKQVIEMFKLNYDVVINKAKQMIKEFLEKEKDHFKGNIALIGGITVNVTTRDHFILKDITYPTN